MVVRKWPEKPEYEKSTGKVNPERVRNGREGRKRKMHEKEGEVEGNKSRKSGNTKRGAETKFCSVQNVRNAVNFANRTTKMARKLEEMSK